MLPIDCKRQISFQSKLAFFAIVGGLGEKNALLKTNPARFPLDHENIGTRLVLIFKDLEFWAFTPTREYANFTFMSNHTFNYKR